MTEAILKLHRLRNAAVFEDITAGDGGPTFTKYNVVYGFNGCGKTTIARILDSISSQGLNSNLPEDVEYLIRLTDGQEATQAAPLTTSSEHISVFSEDFVERALAWKDAVANPIVYLGEQQAGLAERLEKLGAQEAEASAQQLVCATEWAAADAAENQHCTNTARLVSEELAIVRGYTARNLRQDYQLEGIGPDWRVAEQDRVDLKRSILQLNPPDKIDPWRLPADVDLAVEAGLRALGLEVETIAIEALDRRKDALPWVERGLQLHTEETDCLFCGGQLADDRRGLLKAAISSSFQIVSEALATANDRLNEVLETLRRTVVGLEGPLQVVPDLEQREAKARAGLLALLGELEGLVGGLSNALSRKIIDPTVRQDIPDQGKFKGTLDLLHDAVGTLNSIITRHNETVDDHENRKAADKEKLKRHFLADTKNEHFNLVTLAQESRAKLDEADAQLRDIRDEVATIRNEMREHGPAADRMNELIASYLGHGKITIAAEDEGYRICRDGVPLQKPLSEGEKTAIAFCYFIVSLESEGRKLEDLIVVVDDPISSLDARAMAHVVSLIKFSIGKCAQLFILTHNLDFLREMKKWLNSKRRNGEAEFYFIRTRVMPSGQRISTFTELPAVIREYESEYHYLYSLVHNAALEAENAEGYLYLLPNALRKVLETYLAFKQPGYADLGGLTPLIEAYEDVDSMKVRALEALAQTESHAQSIGDTITFSQFTFEQIADAARAFLHLVEVTDPLHFERMQLLCRRAA